MDWGKKALYHAQQITNASAGRGSATRAEARASSYVISCPDSMAMRPRMAVMQERALRSRNALLRRSAPLDEAALESFSAELVKLGAPRMDDAPEYLLDVFHAVRERQQRHEESHDTLNPALQPLAQEELRSHQSHGEEYQSVEQRHASDAHPGWLPAMV